MDGYHLVVVEQFETQAGYRIETEQHLGRILDVQSHIGVGIADLERIEVALYALDITLVGDAEIEGASRLGIEEGTDAAQYIAELLFPVGLSVVVGRKDDRLLELDAAALDTEIDAVLTFEIALVLSLNLEGLDDFALEHVERCACHDFAHRVGRLDDLGDAREHRDGIGEYSFLDYWNDYSSMIAMDLESTETVTIALSVYKSFAVTVYSKADEFLKVKTEDEIKAEFGKILENVGKISTYPTYYAENNDKQAAELRKLIDMTLEQVSNAAKSRQKQGGAE